MAAEEVTVEWERMGRLWGGSVLFWNTFVIPVSVDHHFCVAVVKPAAKRVFIFDSLYNEARSALIGNKVIR